jgi:hypothetical protein
MNTNLITALTKIYVIKIKYYNFKKYMYLNENNKDLGF